jgi:hypothetical protein
VETQLCCRLDVASWWIPDGVSAVCLWRAGRHAHDRQRKYVTAGKFGQAESILELEIPVARQGEGPLAIDRAIIISEDGSFRFESVSELAKTGNKPGQEDFVRYGHLRTSVLGLKAIDLVVF